MSYKNKNLFLKLYLFFINLVYFIRTFKITQFLENVTLCLFFIALLFDFIYLCKKKYSLKSISIIALSFIFSFFVFYYSGRQYEYIILFVLTIVSIKDEDIKEILKFEFLVLLTCFLTHLVLVFFSVIPDSVYIKKSNFGITYISHTLGYGHGNVFYCFYFNLVSLFLYTYKDKLTKFIMFLILCFSLIFYLLTYSRTGFICVIVELIIYYLIIYKKSFIYNAMNLKIVKILFRNFKFILYVLIYFCSTSLYHTAFSNMLNKIITNRIDVSHYYISTFGISIFPQLVPLTVAYDCLYSFCLSSFGLLFVLITCIMYYKLIKKLYAEKKYLEILIIAVFLFYSFSEKILINIFRNMTLSFYAYLMNNKKQVKINE